MKFRMQRHQTSISPRYFQEDAAPCPFFCCPKCTLPVFSQLEMHPVHFSATKNALCLFLAAKLTLSILLTYLTLILIDNTILKTFYPLPLNDQLKKSFLKIRLQNKRNCLIKFHVCIFISFGKAECLLSQIKFCIFLSKNFANTAIFTNL